MRQLFLIGALLAVSAFGAFDRCERAFQLMTGRTPEQFFKENHWTLVDTRALFGKGNKIDVELVETLSRRYDDIFARAKVEAVKAGIKPTEVGPGRYRIEGLSSIASQPTGAHLVRDLPANVAAAIDAWAAEVLRVAKAATGEDLEIKSVSLGKGFVAGGSDPLVHMDNQGTYIHALTTLQGPSTLLFPRDRNLASHFIMSENAETGQLTLRHVNDRKGESPVTSNDAIQAATGQTAIITGMDYLKGPGQQERIPGREGTIHSSPFRPGMDRITLFIDLQPRKK